MKTTSDALVTFPDDLLRSSLMARGGTTMRLLLEGQHLTQERPPRAAWRSWRRIFRGRSRQVHNNTAEGVGFWYTIDVAFFMGPTERWPTHTKSHDLFQVWSDTGLYKLTLAPVAPERDWFLRMKNSLRSGYDGKYVAVSGEKVVASDARLTRLLTRFYRDYGEIDVYFGYVGDEPTVPMPPPIPSLDDSGD